MIQLRRQPLQQPARRMSASSALFAASYDACAPSVAQARAAVSSFAARNGATEEDLDAIRLAVSEAVTNTVVHAYPSGTSGLVEVTVAVAGRLLVVIVADDGCGIGGARETPGLGLGLGLIEHSCGSLTVTNRRSGGTQLEMRFLLSSAAAEQGCGDPPARDRVESSNPLGLTALLDVRAAGGT